MAYGDSYLNLFFKTFSQKLSDSYFLLTFTRIKYNNLYDIVSTEHMEGAQLSFPVIRYYRPNNGEAMAGRQNGEAYGVTLNVASVIM